MQGDQRNAHDNNGGIERRDVVGNALGALGMITLGNIIIPAAPAGG